MNSSPSAATSTNRPPCEPNRLVLYPCGAMTLRLLLTAALLIALVGATSARNDSPQAKAFADATDAWARGDYIASLNGYIALLNGPGGDAYLEPVALPTGELYRTFELTSDGRAPRFSADGRF